MPLVLKYTTVSYKTKLRIGGRFKSHHLFFILPIWYKKGARNFLTTIEAWLVKQTMIFDFYQTDFLSFHYWLEAQSTPTKNQNRPKKKNSSTKFGHILYKNVYKSDEKQLLLLKKR